MPNGAVIIKDAINDFQKVQRRMLLAEDENAIKRMQIKKMIIWH